MEFKQKSPAGAPVVARAGKPQQRGANNDTRGV